jgi:hypothetical protein
MGQQAVVARAGLDEEREVNKRVLNTLISNTSRNERLITLEMIELITPVSCFCLSVCLSVCL